MPKGRKGNKMNNKLIRDAFFKPMARAVQKANVGLTTVLVSRGTSTEDVVLVVTPDTFKLFDENDNFVYDSNPIFIRYEEQSQTLSFNYMLNDEVICDEVTDHISNNSNPNDLYNLLLLKLEEVANILYGI